MLKIDKKDRQILYELDKDCRQPNSRIAKKVRLSKEVVGYRVARMERNGVIKGYYVLVDMTKMGFYNCRIFFKFKGIVPNEEKEFHEYFNHNSSAWWVNSISGSFTDSGVAFWVRDIQGFHLLKEEIFRKYRSKIEFFKDSFYSNIHVWRRSYLSRTDEKVPKYNRIPGNSKAIKFDGQDVKLLGALTKNARMPLVELAKQCSMSLGAARHRLQKLVQKGVILGFRPKISLEKIGYYWYKVEFQLDGYGVKKGLLAYFASHPNIIYAYESIGGGTDIEMEMEVESHQKFREVVDGIRSKFKEAIRSYNYYLWSSEYKIVFFPPEEFFKLGNKKPVY